MNDPAMPSPDSPPRIAAPGWEGFPVDHWDEADQPLHPENSLEIEEGYELQLYRDEQRRQRLPETSTPDAETYTPGASVSYPQRVSVAPTAVAQHGVYIRTYNHPDALAVLTESIRATGRVEQPIGVRWTGDQHAPTLTLVYGSRRLSAACEVGLAAIDATHYGWITDQHALLLQALENETRADPHPVDRALGYAHLVRADVSQADVARFTGKAASFISVMVRAGEAILQLTEQERILLYDAPRARTPQFEALVKLPLMQRVAALRAMIPLPGQVKQSARRRGRTVRFRGGYYKVRATRDAGAVEVVIHIKADELRRNSAAVSRLVKKLGGQIAQGVADEGAELLSGYGRVEGRETMDAVPDQGDEQ